MALLAYRPKAITLPRCLVFYQRGRRVDTEHSVDVFVHGVHVLLKGIDMFLIMILV